MVEKKELECICKDIPRDFSNSDYMPIKQNILRYGIDFVAHAHLMKKARDNLIPGSISLEEFIKKYELNFEKSIVYEERNAIPSWPTLHLCHGFVGSLKSIEKEGIFIPEVAYLNMNYCFISKIDREIPYLSKDYGNLFWFTNKEGKICQWPKEKLDLGNKLIHRKFIPVDLTNIELIEQITIFTRDLWKQCVDDFEEEQTRKQTRDGANIQNLKKITELGRKLIVYYSQFF